MKNYNEIAYEVILSESQALNVLACNIPPNFNQSIDMILKCYGTVIFTGIGKSGYIARKIAATFSSTGTRAFYIHPTEASHGDLGIIDKKDIVIILSNSGNNKELFDILSYCKNFSIPVISITMNMESMIAANSDLVLLIPKLDEVSPIGAPSTSSIMMLALGDAIAILLQKIKNFSKDDFYIYHPGGSLGANLLKAKNCQNKNKL